MTGETFFAWMATRLPHTFWYLFKHFGRRGHCYSREHKDMTLVGLQRARHLFRAKHTSAHVFGGLEEHLREIESFISGENKKELQMFKNNAVFFTEYIHCLAGVIDLVDGKIKKKDDASKLLKDLKEITHDKWFKKLFKTK